MQWLEVGKIVAPQGLQGEVRIYSESDFPERFEQPGRRWLQSADGAEPQAIELLQGRYLSHKGLYVVKFVGIDSREQAEALRGSKLLVSANDRPSLEDGEVYWPDLIGMEVFNQLTQSVVGTVVDTMRAGNDVLEVQLRQMPNTTVTEVNDTEAIQSKAKGRKQRQTIAQSTKQTKVLIPFVEAIVPIVDFQQRRIEINPPKGLIPDSD